MASVLTPYRSSDGNNPYTEAQLKVLWKDLEPQAKAPGKYTLEERVKLQRAFLEFIVQGYSPTRAVEKLKETSRRDPSKMPYAEYGTFMAWKAHDPDFRDAYEVAYAMGTDKLEDKAVEMAYGGNASILQFLLRVRNPKRYNPKQEHVVEGKFDHVHRVELVAAKPEPRQIEHQRGEEVRQIAPRADILDAEVEDVDR